MFKTNLIIFSLLIYGFVGCKEETTSIIERQPTTVIVPLSVGNKWIRAVALYDTSGNVFSSSTDSIVVLRDTIVFGSRWFVLKKQGLEYPMVNRPDGLWCLNGAGTPFIWYKFPAVKGDSFYQGSTIPERIYMIDTVITLNMGSFTCYEYVQEIAPWVGAIGGSRFIQFLSPNVGYIKSEFYQSTFTSERQYLYSRIQLIRLQLNR